MEYFAWLIWSLPILGACLTPIFSRVHSRIRDYAAVAFSLGAAVSATVTIFVVHQGDYQVPWVSQLNLTAGVLVDPLSLFLANIAAWISFLIMVYSLQYMKNEFGLTRYWFFMNLFIGNMLLLILADNLLMMFFGWEGVGLCSYALIGHFYHDEPEHWVGTPGDKALGVSETYSPSQAGMKAFVMTRIGDVALLIAIFLIYATSSPHSFNYNDLAAQLGNSGSWAGSLARIGLLVPTALLFFGGPIGKSAQFPLQEWLPDAMAGPTSVSALIHAATMVKAGVFLVGRMGPIFFLALYQFNGVTPFFGTIAWIGAFTAFLAATQATVATEIKKVLAYSTVSQIGYMMMGLGIAGLSANFIAGYSASLFQLMSHAVFKASLFLAAGWVIHATGTRFMDQMGGLGKAMRLTSVSMLLAGLSLMGIPPFSGFWTKDAILSATFQSSQYILYAVGLATVLLTAFYTTRMLGLTFAGKSRSSSDAGHEEGHLHDASLVMLIPYLLLAIASLGLGLAYPLLSGPLTNYLAGTFQSLPAGLPVGSVPGLATSDLLLLGISAGLAVVGLALGYVRYFMRPYQPSARTGGLSGFLFHRWYIDAIYYRVFVGGITRLSKGLYRLVEQGVWDRLSPSVAKDIIDYTSASGTLDSDVVDGAVNDVASAGSRLSNAIRRLQSGVTEQYVITFAIGVLLLLAYMIFVIGAR